MAAGRARPDPPGLDLIIKPRRGHGAQNVQFCHTSRQARVLCELIDDPIVPERLHDTEFTADCLVDRDGTVSVIPRRRLLVRNGLAMVAATFQDDQVAETVTATLAAIAMTAGSACCAPASSRAGSTAGRVARPGRSVSSEIDLPGDWLSRSTPASP